jgi:hypothetical protein
MIHAIDRNQDFDTHWHVPPPHPDSRFIITQGEWIYPRGPGGLPQRHVHSWHYVPLASPDEQGWRPVPGWWREMA